MERQRQANARNGRADSARKARLILPPAEGSTWAEIRAKLDCGDSCIHRRSGRSAAEHLAGLLARHAGRQPCELNERVEARVPACATERKPADGAPQGSPSSHANVLVLAEPGRGLVRQDRARRDRPRRLCLGPRSEAKTHARHPPIQQHKPMKWKYLDLSNRIASSSAMTVH